MCNNNCCMCCKRNTNNEEGSQEVVYTSVCNSDVCKQNANCCCNCDELCENDPIVSIMGLSEHMEECCELVLQNLTEINCKIEDIEHELDEHQEKNEEQDERLDDLEHNESLDFNRVEYITRDQSDDHKAYIEFYHNDDYLDRISAEPFLKDGVLDSVDLESDGHTLHFVWNTDAGKQDSHVDIDRLVQPISTTVSNLKNSIAGYNPELGYDGTAVTVGQIDGKQFKVHMATFPELVSTVSEDYAHNRFAVTTNKGNTNYIELKNSTYETSQHASDTYETKVAAGNHYTNASINDHTLTLIRDNNTNPTNIQLPDNNTDTLVKQNSCTDNVAIPVLLAYGANPTTGTSAETNYSSVTINPHTSVINGTATQAISDGSGNNIVNTYETKADANNHVTGGSFDNSTRNLTLTKQSGSPVVINIPDANTDNYLTGASISGHTLTLTRNNSLSDLTVNLPDDDHNYYVTGGSVSGSTLTLTRSGGLSDITIQLPSWSTTDNDHYVTAASVSGNTLTLSRNGGLSDVTCQLPSTTDNDHYPTSGSVSNNVLTISGNSGFTPFTVDLSGVSGVDNDHYPTAATLSGNTLTFTGNTGFTSFSVDLSSIAGIGTDNDHYVTSAALDGNTLKLTRDGISGTVDVDLSSLATDNDHYVTSGTLDNNTLKLTRQGITGTVDVDLSSLANGADNDHYSTSGTYSDSGKKITISGNSGFTSYDIDLTALINRIEALESLWEVSATDSTRLVAKNGRSAQAAGFYDSTVS